MAPPGDRQMGSAQVRSVRLPVPPLRPTFTSGPANEISLTLISDPPMQDHLHAIGIMTGNSLDGADLVLTRFGRDDATIEDIRSHAVPFPEDLKAALRSVRSAINAAGGRVEVAIDHLGPGVFAGALEHYTALLAAAVAELRARVPEVAVDLIGLHGQTCAHRPPSIAVGDGDVYTVQLGDAQALADRTNLTVVADFRSDDLMAGGEGAPLAPVHHRHLAASARGRGIWPIAFANGGNTGNISIISADRASGEPRVVGWDTGPFNHFPDRLMQLQGGQPCDWDGAVGRRGRIDLALLGVLFRSAVATGRGDNYLLRSPPKSSDPEWYRLVPELLGAAPVGGRIVPWEDRVRTATYFSCYAFFHSLSLIPAEVSPPTFFAVCGGGWRNPLCLADFRGLLGGRDDDAPILPEHAARLAEVRAWTARAIVNPSSTWGYDGTAMEARIFADAAVCRIKGEPFTLPATTGVRGPTVCGVICFPAGDRSRATAPVRAWLDHFGSEEAASDRRNQSDGRWSRAAAGWKTGTGREAR